MGNNLSFFLLKFRPIVSSQNERSERPTRRRTVWNVPEMVSECQWPCCPSMFPQPPTELRPYSHLPLGGARDPLWAVRDKTRQDKCMLMRACM